MGYRKHSFISLATGGFHRIAYVEWGDSSAKPIVICVHGLSRNSRDFDFLARELAAERRVVCMDVAGRGDSDWLANKADYRFSTYLTDAAMLVARVTAPAVPKFFGTFRGPRNVPQGLSDVDWVGTSMGGLIGMLLAAKRGSPIRRLVLNDVGPFIPWGSLYRLKGHIAGNASFADLAAVEAYLREVCAGFGPLTDEQWGHLARHGATVHGGSLRLRYDPAIGDGLRVGQPDPEFPLGPNYLAGIDLWSVWSQIRCPTLVLRGAQSDVLSRETLVQMRAVKPDLETLELEGIGHAPWLMSGDQIAAIRGFLAR